MNAASAPHVPHGDRQPTQVGAGSHSAGITPKVVQPELPFSRSYWARPGKLAAGCYPGDIDPDEARAKLSGLLRCGVTHMLNLMEEHEHDLFGRLFVDYTSLMEQLARSHAKRVACLRRPIPDMDVPSPDAMRSTLDLIDATIRSGGVIYMHCLAGKGRTGTVVGCYLVRHGLTGPAALDRLKELTFHRSDVFWPTPQTSAQREFVLGWRPGH